MARLPQPSAVAMTMPRTSPMAQPVRQWTVALNASAFSDPPARPSAVWECVAMR